MFDFFPLIQWILHQKKNIIVPGKTNPEQTFLKAVMKDSWRKSKQE